jgi:putative flippase GtrA
MSGSASPRIPWLSRRIKSALLWGLVGALAFLALVQGYALFVEPLVTITEGAAVAFAVGVGTTVGAYVLEHRIAAWSARRAAE